ncbi:MAG TPA: hypothetical protein VFW65_40375 [Pseudonocardiaceae bacterium]|nr:hypothetical protein [Pseudonocardiaceae bacterium]
MADELDPERLYLRDELRRQVMPWLVRRALGIAEIREGIEQSDLARDTLERQVSATDHVVLTTGPEFETVFRQALGKDDRVDRDRLAKELRLGDWPIRWGTFYETSIRSVKPGSLGDALSDWCSTALRDGVVPELRRMINAQVSGEFSTELRIGAVPGLMHAQEVTFTVATDSARMFLAAVTRTHGNGAIGLAGPRGSGKTTLIQRYITGLHGTGRTRAPLAVLVSCPVHYEARDFVLHLHASLCRAVADRIRGTNRGRSSPRALWLGAFLGPVGRLVFSLVVLGLALTPVLARIDYQRPVLPQAATVSVTWWMQPLLLVAGCALVIFVSNLLRSLRVVVEWAIALPFVSVQLAGLSILAALVERHNGPDRRSGVDDAMSMLSQRARTQLRQIRMLQTSTTGWSGKLTLPLATEASATKSIQFAERPLTYPEVVGALRELIQDCVETLGPMVIAIDELDKMASAEQARSFINDIKGIFGVAGCLYLVSMSEDAVSTFERSGLGIRDAFDSAFDEIVSLEYASLSDSLDLLRSRVIGISEPFGYLCFCLSGGLPRELVRVIRRVAEYRADAQPKSLSIICRELVWHDLATKIREFQIVAARIGDRYRTAFLRCLIQLPPDASVKDLLDLTRTLIRQQASASHHPTLDRLRLAAAMHAYHSATLRQIFTDTLDEQRARHARDHAASPGSFDRLGRARHLMGVDPQLGWLLLDEFREAWNLEVVSGQ